MAFTNVWDVTQPPDTQAANLLGLDIRNFKTDIMQRVSALAGTLANRPAPETVNADWTGLIYFAVDTFQLFQWDGAAWQDMSGDLPPAQQLATSGAPVVIVGSAPPVTGNSLIATGPTTAVWGAPGSMGYKFENCLNAPFVFNAGAGSATIYSFNVNANELATGQSLRLRQGCTLGTPGANESVQIDVFLDATNILSFSGIFAEPRGMSGNGTLIDHDFIISCVSSPAGNVHSYGVARYSAGTTTSETLVQRKTVAVDMSLGHVLTVVITLSSGNAANIYTMENTLLERIG